MATVDLVGIVPALILRRMVMIVLIRQSAVQGDVSKVPVVYWILVKSVYSEEICAVVKVLFVCWYVDLNNKINKLRCFFFAQADFITCLINHLCLVPFACSKYSLISNLSLLQYMICEPSLGHGS